MIISDEHGFVFVHIPKCAGTSVRQHIKQYSSRKKFTLSVSEHPALGKLDYSHIPLFILRKHFPHDFEVFQNYSSFAVVRNPFDRFASSLAQLLSHYKGKYIQHCSRKEIHATFREIIEYLTENDNYLLSNEFIHFQRQVDYIQLDGEQIIENIYTIDQIKKLIADIESKLGSRLENSFSHTSNTYLNRSFVYRNHFLRIAHVTLGYKLNSVVKVLPESIKQKARDCVYASPKNKLSDILEKDHVQAFIRDYYSDDIILYQGVLEA